MKKLFSEFKKFISKGNIFDLAVAVVLGNAFNKIINSLVSSIIMPFIGLILGGSSVENWVWVIKTNAEGEIINAIYIGVFLQAIIDFLIIAICLFITVKIINVSKERIEKFKNVLLKDINELTKWDKKRLKKQGIDLAKLEALGHNGKICDLLKELEPKEQPALPMPSKEEVLLTEIRDLLAKNANSEEAKEVAKKLEE